MFLCGRDWSPGDPGSWSAHRSQMARLWLALEAVIARNNRIGLHEVRGQSILRHFDAHRPDKTPRACEQCRAFRFPWIDRAAINRVRDRDRRSRKAPFTIRLHPAAPQEPDCVEASPTLLADFNLDNTSIGLLIALPTLRLSALPFAGDQVNAVLLVPAGRLNDDFGKRPLARQHRGQKYVVVARVRLAADHSNVEAVGSPRNELLDRSHFPPFRCRRPPTAVVASGLMLMLTRALWQGSTSCAGSATT